MGFLRIVLAATLLYFAKVVFIPIFLGLFLAMLLDPVVLGLARVRLGRQPAALLVTAALAGAGALLGWMAYLASSEIVVSIPHYVEQLNLAMERLGRFSNQFAPALRSGVPVVQMAQPANDWARYLIFGAGTAYSTLSILLFVPLLMFYFLIEKENLLESFNVVNGRYFNLPKLNSELPRMLRLFVAVNVGTAGLLVLLQTPVFYFLGYENWMTLGLVSGVVNVAPVIGGPLGILLPALLGVGVPLDMSHLLTLASIIMVLHFISNNILVPIFVGSRLNINSVTILSGLLLWSWMWGIAGFFLAVPMTAVIKILLECNPETLAFANLMASHPRLVRRRPTSPTTLLTEAGKNLSFVDPEP